MEKLGKIIKNFPQNTLLQRVFNDFHFKEELSPEEKLRRNLNVSSLESTFENFKKRKGTEVAYQAFCDFATLENPKPFLGCYGGVGSGKSHLLEAAALKLYERGIFARVIPADTMFSSLKKGMSDRVIPSYQDVLESYCKMPILLLDDIGMGMTESDWAYSVLETIVLHRFHERLKTIFVTNKDFAELPERVVSRFKDGELSVLVLNEAGDYRRLK